VVKFFKNNLKYAGAAISLAPSAALAQASRITPLDPLRGGSLETTVGRIITWILWLAGALAVVYLIYGGIIYITSAGNAEKATAGKNAIIYSIIGIIIILIAYLVVGWVTNILTSGQA